MAVDLKHYRQLLYLFVVDYEPDRFAIWRELRIEDTKEMQAYWCIFNNGQCFFPRNTERVYFKWNVSRVFRAVYSSSVKSIVEKIIKQNSSQEKSFI